MKTLSPNAELLLAAWRFAHAPRENRESLSIAIELPVEGRLYCQLRDACRNALKAEARDVHLVTAGIGELITAIGEMLPPRVPAGSSQLQLPYSV